MEFGMFDNSECSSGCESGWTVYLENSIMAPYSSYNNGNKFLRGKARVNGEEEEEEDLSMVSDASSGPPQVVAEDDYANDSHGWCFHAPNGSALPKKSIVKRQRKKEKKENRLQNLKEKASMLDDTASSPIFNCNNGQSAYQEHCEFFQSSLLPVKPRSLWASVLA